MITFNQKPKPDLNKFVSNFINCSDESLNKLKKTKTVDELSQIVIKGLQDLFRNIDTIDMDAKKLRKKIDVISKDLSNKEKIHGLTIKLLFNKCCAPARRSEVDAIMEGFFTKVECNLSGEILDYIHETYISLKKENRNSQYLEEILAIFYDMPLDEALEFVRLATPWTDTMRVFDLKVSILATLKEIPRNERAEFNRKVLPIIQNIKSEFEQVLVLKILSPVPQQHLAVLIKQFTPLLEGCLYNHAELIKFVKSISEEEREDVIKHTLPLVGNFERGVERSILLTAINEIPKYLRGHVVENVLPPIKGLREVFEICQSLLNTRNEFDHKITLLLQYLDQVQKNIASELILIGLPIQFLKLYEPLQNYPSKAKLAENFASILSSIALKYGYRSNQLIDIWNKVQDHRAEFYKQIIKAGDLKLLEALLNVPNDVNIRDSFGNTPLINAAYEGKKDIVEFLLNKGADPLLWSTSGRAIHNSMKRGFPEVTDLLIPSEKHPSVPKFFMLQKMLCHRFGTDYKVETRAWKSILLEGFDEEYTFPELCRSLTAFINDFSTSANNPDTKATWQRALRIISKALDNKNILNQNEGTIFDLDDPEDIKVIPVRFHDFSERRGHSAGLVTNLKQQLLVKCNRGLGNDSACGLDVKGIRKWKQIEKSLREVTKRRFDEGGQDYFNKNLRIDLKFNEVGHMPHKEQHGGTCTWSSAKLDLRAVLYLILRKTIDHQNANILSLSLYKEWTQFDRAMAIKEFCSAIEEIEKIQKTQGFEDWKEEGIVYEDLLKLIAKKCVRERLVEPLKLLIDKFPQLKPNFAEAFFQTSKKCAKLLADQETEDLIPLIDHLKQAKIYDIFFINRHSVENFSFPRCKADLYWACNGNTSIEIEQGLLNHFKKLPDNKKKELERLLLSDLRKKETSYQIASEKYEQEIEKLGFSRDQLWNSFKRVIIFNDVKSAEELLKDNNSLDDTTKCHLIRMAGKNNRLQITEMLLKSITNLYTVRTYVLPDIMKEIKDEPIVQLIDTFCA